MPLTDRFDEYIKQESLFNKDNKLLLAVSGGVDSVVLCELCARLNFEFAIAHCNFQLREGESDRDEKFVSDLAKKYGKEFFVKKFDTAKYADEKKLSTQVAARELRYAWFLELLTNKELETEQPGKINASLKQIKQRPGVADRIVTAHHADDNIETLLMNFFRGTGISGLHGILPSHGKIVRPLLFAHKKELLLFATENNLEFIEDSSNASDKYTRNYFRNQLIPSIQKVFPQVEENLAANIARFSDIEILYQQAVSDKLKKLQVQHDAEVHIPVMKLLKAKPLNTIVYELVKPYGFTPHQVSDILHLLKSESGKYVQSPSHRIIRNRKWLIISPNDTSIALNIQIQENDNTVTFVNGSKLKIERMQSERTDDLLRDVKTPKAASIALLDAGKISFPLLLRKWKQGDYFYPLGMQKKKKLSRFFIDQKLSIPEKENTWVLETNKKIIWVVGQRIDDRFKITHQTKNIVRFSLC